MVPNHSDRLRIKPPRFQGNSSALQRFIIMLDLDKTDLKINVGLCQLSFNSIFPTRLNNTG